MLMGKEPERRGGTSDKQGSSAGWVPPEIRFGKGVNCSTNIFLRRKKFAQKMSKIALSQPKNALNQPETPKISILTRLKPALAPELAPIYFHGFSFFRLFLLGFFIMDIVAFMQGGISQIVSVFQKKHPVWQRDPSLLF